MTEICFASNNAHKLSEVRHILGPDFRILSLADIGCSADIPETADTFEGNSLQKANYVLSHFGIPCFADDSGLVVPVLNNEPGVFSARYAGPQRSDSDNIDLLLTRLRSHTDRSAYFIALIGFVTPQASHTFEGRIEGTILTERRGTGGFGYDPVFLPNGYQQTFAEMTLELKSKLSHRAIAVRALANFLRTHYLRET
jgi:XTP/dITP diphosphohydrolase